MKEYDVPAEVRELFLQAYVAQIMVKGCVEALQYEKAEKYAQESVMLEQTAWKTAQKQLGLSYSENVYSYNKATDKITEFKKKGED